MHSRVMSRNSRRSASSWEHSDKRRSRLYEPDRDDRWQAYASIKFEGVGYGGQGKEDRVLVDRAILVKQ